MMLVTYNSPTESAQTRTLPYMTGKRMGEGLGPNYGRVVQARMVLEDAAASVVHASWDVADFSLLGTEHLPAAVAALTSSKREDEIERAARWLSDAFTARPGRTPVVGVPALAFCGSVLMMRFALQDLDESLTAADAPASNNSSGE